MSLRNPYTDPRRVRVFLRLVSEMSFSIHGSDDLETCYRATDGAFWELIIGQRYMGEGPVWHGSVQPRERRRRQSRRRHLWAMRHDIFPAVFIPPLVGFWVCLTWPTGPGEDLPSRFDNMRICATLHGVHGRPVA